MTNSQNERRSHRRFHVRDKIVLYNGSTFAEVLNISQGGILCRYLLDTDEQQKPVDEIDLIDSPGKVFIQKIPCDDVNYQKEIQGLFGSMAVRNCRLKFGALNIDKRKKLERFIEAVKTNPAQEETDTTV